MTSWFRFYGDTLNNPKAQKLPAELFKIWVNMLCIASKNDGVLPSMDDLAFHLRLSEAQVSDAIEKLIKAELIDSDEGLKPHNWDKRQFKSDDSSERVKKHRDKKRDGNGPCNGDVTPPDTEQIQITDTEQKEPPKPPRGPVDAESFKAWYEKYPHKVGKAAAEKAFPKALKKTTLETLLTALERYTRDKPPDRAWCNPATWLNEERWLDQPSEIKGDDPPKKEPWEMIGVGIRKSNLVKS